MTRKAPLFSFSFFVPHVLGVCGGGDNGSGGAGEEEQGRRGQEFES